MKQKSEEVLYKKGILVPIILLEIPILIGVGFIPFFYKLKGGSIVLFVILVMAGLFIFIGQALSRDSVRITRNKIKMYFPILYKDKKGHKHELILREKNLKEIKFIFPFNYEFPNITRKGIILGTTDGRVGEIFDHSHDIVKLLQALEKCFGDKWSDLYKSEKYITSHEEYYNTLIEEFTNV